MPELTLSVRLGLYAFIALMIGAILLYHYLGDPPRKATATGANPPPETEPASPSGSRAPSGS